MSNSVLQSTDITEHEKTEVVEKMVREQSKGEHGRHDKVSKRL